MQRLQKVMAHAGVASRRKCEEIIEAGRVKVNGKIVTELGTRVDTSDVIEVDGVPIYKEEPRYFVFYKPKNVLSSVSDDKNRPVVLDYFQDVEERIYPIGRLDFDTTGLLLMTNDGEFAHLMMHPSFQLPKTYRVQANGRITDDSLLKLENGVKLDGKVTSKAKTKFLNYNANKDISTVELTIHEGWNHQVKRMFQAVGHRVVSLKRESFGFVTLDDLRPGEWRVLTAFEVDKLKKIAQANI